LIRTTSGGYSPDVAWLRAAEGIDMDKVETDSSVLFKDDSDRRAWRVYAAAALQGLLAGERFGDVRVEFVYDQVRIGAACADVMLVEERKRRGR
jgi:hypothetical protein